MSSLRSVHAKYETDESNETLIPVKNNKWKVFLNTYLVYQVLLQ